MTPEEIKDIISRGCDRLGISPAPTVVDEVAGLAGGFPHYAHLLGLAIARACVERHTTSVDSSVFNDLACNYAVEDSQETFRQAFNKATRTSRESRYPQILCACGEANHDEEGVFRATDVGDAYRRLFEETLAVQAIVPALQAFSTDERGMVLERVPCGGVTHYRFRDPMMRPFLRIRTRTLSE